MPKPITILIADDEHLVRKGIRHLLSHQSDFQIVAEAGNGLEAVELTRQYHPQIILMDVRMPVQDGLAALEQIKEIDSLVKTVILSGHSDFAYARKALKLGASDYMLKPTDLPGLVNVLHRLKDVILEEEMELQKEAKVQQQLNYGISAFMEQFYWQLLGSEFLADELAEKMRILEITADKGLVFLISMDDCYQLKMNCAKEEYLSLCFRIKLLLQEFVTSQRVQSSPILQTEDDSFILIYFTVDQLQPAHFAQDLKEWLKEKSGRIFTIAIGSEQSIDKIGFSYHQAFSRLRQRLIIGGDKVISEDLSFQERQISYPIEVEKELAKAIRFGDQENAKLYLDKIFQLLEPTGKLSPNKWQQLCFELFEMGYKIAQELNIKLSADYSPLEKGREISILTTVTDIRTWLEENLAGMMEQIGVHKSEPSLAIKKAMSYMDEHFAEDLTLSTLASHIGLSPNYLSQIFKQETGKTFLEHLTNRRLEEAKKLLKQGDLNVSEVSFRIGYDNPRYFSELFHKQEKVTPGQYRKSIR